MYMKKQSLVYALTLAFASITMLGCESKSGSEAQVPGEEPTEINTEESAPAPEKMEAVCIWNNISVREEPSQKGKWLTSLSLGEQLTALNITAKDSIKDRDYVKVILKDGTEGWSISSFIVTNASGAAVRDEANIYKRPDLLTKTDEAFSPTDIVAVIETDGDWALVKGQRTGDTWIDEGWVKSDNLSHDAVDMAVAKFAKEAFAKEDPASQSGALEEILDNDDFGSSVFIPSLREKLTELQSEL